MADDFRGHSAVVIDEFRGLYKRGDADTCPPDHFSDCNNIKFSQSSFSWRNVLIPYFPIANVVRGYAFVKPIGQSSIVLDSSGNFWDTDFPTTPILTVSGATDFGFSGFATRCYISPSNGNTGLASEFTYVYLGDGTLARKAGGAKPTTADGALASVNSATAGNVEAGIHIFGAVYETNTGFLTAIGPGTLPTVTAPGDKKVDLSVIPISPNSFVTKVHLIATKAINPTFYTGDTRGYQFFFIPNAIVNNGVTTLTVSFFDSELIEDASYLLDMFEDIPAFNGISTYHNRLVGWAENANPTVIRISTVGEPEAFDQVSGLVIFPVNGRPVTNAKEYRDILYGFNITETVAWSDNGDDPSSWPLQIVDNGLGASPHMVATVLDSNAINAEYILIGNISGLYLFNGAFQLPELSWKIRNLWLSFSRDNSYKNQLCNDSINQYLYMVIDDGTMLYADYSEGLSTKAIKWTPWTFDVHITSIWIIAQLTVLSASGLLEP